MKNLITLALALAATLVTAIPYDGFNYTLGSNIDGANGGTDWLTPWFADGDVVVGDGLSYTDGLGIPLLTSGNSMEFRMSLLNSPMFPYAFRIPAEIYVSGQVYCSFIWHHVSSVIGADLYSGFTTTNAVNHGIVTEHSEAVFKLNGISTTLDKLEAGTQAFIVLMADLDAHTLSIWINPNLESPDAADETVLASYAAPIESFTFSQSNLIELGATNQYDEIRIGTTWAEVAPTVPEPAIFGFTLIAILGLCLRK